MKPQIPPHAHSSKTTCAPDFTDRTASYGEMFFFERVEINPFVSIREPSFIPGGRRRCFCFEEDDLASETISRIVDLERLFTTLLSRLGSLDELFII